MVKILERLKKLLKTRGVKKEKLKFQQEAKQQSKPEEKPEEQK